MTSARQFPIAPMGKLFFALTVVLLAVPTGLVIGSLFSTKAGPFLFGFGVFFAAVYAFVYVRMRPNRFEIGADSITLRFPLRTLSYPRASVARLQLLDFEAFRGRYPRPIRLGSGGLWGGFGLLLTKNGKVYFYISRFRDLVLIEFNDGRPPLLVSPERPSEFVESLR